MRTAELLIPHSSPRSPRRQEPHWDDRIVARLLAPRIDPALANVTLPWSPATHAARAMLRAVLREGGGPCYARSHPAALTVRLQQVSRCLRLAY
jgi:hypothetical protein